MTISSHTPYQGMVHVHTLLAMAQDLVLAQMRAKRLLPETIPCTELFSLQKC